MKYALVVIYEVNEKIKFKNYYHYSRKKREIMRIIELNYGKIKENTVELN